MGNKDKTRDGDAATSTETNRDHSRDQEARDATLAKTIAQAVVRETQSIAEVFAREMAKAHVQYCYKPRIPDFRSCDCNK